jgi:hypothetical protein
MQSRGHHQLLCSSWCCLLHGAQTCVDVRLSTADQGPSSVSVQQLMFSGAWCADLCWCRTEYCRAGTIVSCSAADDVYCMVHSPLLTWDWLVQSRYCHHCCAAVQLWEGLWILWIGFVFSWTPSVMLLSELFTVSLWLPWCDRGWSCSL